MSAPTSAFTGTEAAWREPVAISEIERLQWRIRAGLWLPGAFLAAVVLLFVAADSLTDWTCALLVLAAAYLPMHLWASRRVMGMPTMPVLALGYAVFYALPFVSGNAIVAEFAPEEKLTAAATVAGVLVLSTVAWAIIAGTGVARARTVRMIVPGRNARTFLACLALGCAYQINAFLWLVNIPYEWFGVLRAILHNLGLISVFALSFLFGARQLGRRASIAYAFLAPVFVAASVMGLYLNGAMEIVFLALFGFFLGRGRVPWKFGLLVLAFFAVLHAGKATMREQYWSPETGLTPPANPVVTIRQWMGYGIDNLLHPPAGEDSPGSLLDRASLMHMLLRTQTEAPERVPFLYGDSYTGVPLLLVPRFIWPERPSTQEMLIRLNEHYGLLTRDEAVTTSIGWGLVAEAYANFGFGGVFMMAVLMGAGLGFLQRWGGRYPMLSARAITILIVLLSLLRLETNFALLATSLFQALAPTVLVSWLLMEPRRVVV